MAEIPGTLNFYLADPTEKGAGLLANGAAIGGAIAAIYLYCAPYGAAGR